jgi:hypothetical protein
VTRIQEVAVAKVDALVAGQVAREAKIITAINAITDPAHLMVITTGTTPEDCRKTLNDNLQLGGINLGADLASESLLTDPQTTRIQQKAIEKLQSLNVGLIKGAIAGIIDPDHPALEALAKISIPTTSAELTAKLPGIIVSIRQELTKWQAELGPVDVSNEKLLSDVDTINLRTAAIQKRNALIIEKSIIDTTLDDPTVCKMVAKATRVDTILAALKAGRENFGGDNLIKVGVVNSGVWVEFINNQQAAYIQKLAISNYNACLIKQAISTITHPDLLEDVAKAAIDGDAIRAALNTDKAHLGNTHLRGGSASLTDKDAISLQTFAKERRDALVANPVRRANVIMEKSGGMLEGFTDRKTTSPGNVPDSPAVGPVATILRTALPGNAIYEGQVLKEGEVIESSKKFAVAPSATPRAAASPDNVIGTLVQDHTGKVTDITKNANLLQEKDLAMLALKQAQMMLTNYKPGDGDIIIEGSSNDKDQANRVYAALLYLKENDPNVGKVAIKSHVPGCIKPTGWLTSQANREFIKVHLKTLSPQLLDMTKRETGLLIAGATAIHKATLEKEKKIAGLRQPGGSLSADLKKEIAELQKSELKEGDELSSDAGGQYKKTP